MNTEGVEEWIFNEIKIMNEIAFFYTNVDESPLMTATILASWMLVGLIKFT